MSAGEIYGWRRLHRDRGLYFEDADKADNSIVTKPDWTTIGHEGLFIRHNEQNRGYTGKINHGIAKANEIDPTWDVILLNSDTRVTPQWLEIIQWCALQSPSTCTVSTISDNAEPSLYQYTGNPVSPWMTEDDHACMILSAIFTI